VRRLRPILLVGLVLLLGAGLLSAASGGRTRVLGPADPEGAWFALDAETAKRDHAPVLPDQARTATFGFDAGIDPSWQRMFADAVAGARPEAQRLIGLVDGLVTVGVGPTGGSALGYAEQANDRFRVVVDLPQVLRTEGPRGVSRLVLHELGHVVDRAIVPTALDHELDAKVPRGYECPPGVPVSACAPQEERFAETFAKWAMDDIGVDIYIGYGVLPPDVPLDTWGAPLSALAGSAASA